jgi:hypothetical protein
VPELNIVRPTPNSIVLPDQDFTVSGTAVDRGGAEPITIDSVSVTVDGGAAIPAQLTPGRPGPQTVVNFEAQTSVSNTQGAHTVTVTATNDLGRSVTGSVAVVVGTSGDGGVVSPGGMGASGPRQLMWRVDPLDLQDVRQALDYSRCVSTGQTIDGPNGPEIVVTADCSDDAAESLLRFMRETWEWRPDAGIPIPINTGEPLPREAVQQRRKEREALRRENLGNRLLNPPANFGDASRQLAQQIKDVVDALGLTQKLLVGGWLGTLLTTPTPETLATQGYDPTELVNALQGLDKIEREKIRQLITFELIKQPPSLSTEERKYWDAVRRALNRDT